MSKRLQHIEDFVRRKLGMLEGDSQPDWMDFERKLRRATRIRQMKRAAGMVGMILLLGFSQTFISGDWSLNRGNTEDSAIGLTEKDSNQALMGDFQSEETPPKALTVIHQPESNRQVADNIASTASITERTSLPEEMPRNQPKTEPALALNSEELPVITRDIPVLEPIQYSPQIADLTPGALIENGVVTGEMPVPFDYESPRSTLSEADLAHRAPDFLKNRPSAGPYISPLQEKRPWTYSLNLYPNFAFREFKIDPTKRALLHSDFIDAMQHSESSGVNVNLGLEVSRRIGPITYLNAGIEYINNSYNAEYDFLNFRDANFDQNGEIINYTLLDNPQRITFSDLNSFHFLNLPVSISYQPWATDHLRINLEFGFSLLYFLEAQGSTIDYRTLEQIDLSDRSYRKYMASSSLKIGLQYYLSPNMNIGFEPTLMYFTNSIYTEEYPFEVIPYSMGLNLNLQMKLQ